jgi:hypothetical protein
MAAFHTLPEHGRGRCLAPNWSEEGSPVARSKTAMWEFPTDVTMMEYFTKHSMYLNRGEKVLVAKQLASEIWNLSLAKEMPPISFGWKAVQEQTVSNCTLGLEARKAEGVCTLRSHWYYCSEHSYPNRG